jgi:hypothetical protein
VRLAEGDADAVGLLRILKKNGCYCGVPDSRRLML